jgi:hypothetical protein
LRGRAILDMARGRGLPASLGRWRSIESEPAMAESRDIQSGRLFTLDQGPALPLARRGDIHGYEEYLQHADKCERLAESAEADELGAVPHPPRSEPSSSDRARGLVSCRRWCGFTGGGSSVGGSFSGGSSTDGGSSTGRSSSGGLSPGGTLTCGGSFTGGFTERKPRSFGPSPRM